MARSYRTQKTEILAERRMARRPDGEIQYPRVVERRPRPGDSHPLRARWLRSAMRRRIPLEYLYGLRQVEHRARQSEEVGQPFGEYRIDEKIIVLYSLPMSWVAPRGCDSVVTASLFGAQALNQGAGKVSVVWPTERQRGIWFYCWVLAHELGHHHQYQYRTKKRVAIDVLHQEIVADLHSGRFYRELIRNFARFVAERRAAQQAASAEGSG